MGREAGRVAPIDQSHRRGPGQVDEIKPITFVQAAVGDPIAAA
jgi:hypothetical protein